MVIYSCIVCDFCSLTWNEIGRISVTISVINAASLTWTRLWWPSLFTCYCTQNFIWVL